MKKLFRQNIIGTAFYYELHGFCLSYEWNFKTVVYTNKGVQEYDLLPLFNSRKTLVLGYYTMCIHAPYTKWHGLHYDDIPEDDENEMRTYFLDKYGLSTLEFDEKHILDEYPFPVEILKW